MATLVRRQTKASGLLFAVFSVMNELPQSTICEHIHSCMSICYRVFYSYSDFTRRKNSQSLCSDYIGKRPSGFSFELQKAISRFSIFASIPLPTFSISSSLSPYPSFSPSLSLSIDKRAQSVAQTHAKWPIENVMQIECHAHTDKYRKNATQTHTESATCHKGANELSDAIHSSQAHLNHWCIAAFRPNTAINSSNNKQARAVAAEVEADRDRDRHDPHTLTRPTAYPILAGLSCNQQFHGFSHLWLAFVELH